MGPTLIYRTFFSRTVAWATAGVSTLALVFFVVTGGLVELARSGGFVVLVAALAWSAFEYPYVAVSDGGVTIRNIVRTVHVPWPAYQGLSTAWQLRVKTPDGEISSWAIPAPSRTYAGKATNPDLPATVEAGAAPINIWHGVHAEVVARAIEERHQSLTAQGWLAKSNPVPVERSWNSAMLQVVVVAALLTLFGALV